MKPEIVAKELLGRERRSCFQVSIWKFKKVIPVQPGDDYGVEREFDETRACIRFSKWNRAANQWVPETLWCPPHQLENLRQVLKLLADRQEKGIAGGDAQ